MTMAGAEWQTFPEEQRAQYYKLAAEDRLAHIWELAEFAEKYKTEYELYKPKKRTSTPRKKKKVAATSPTGIPPIQPALEEESPKKLEKKKKKKKRKREKSKESEKRPHKKHRKERAD
eukprot:TRINITY_DN1459_c0_g1_i1.p2 TRINITY_DN1459_c0_g1~~TRINITY_DN1459_c0_g1_i1.p2  ORF type:complete len:118 (-),score=51.83 TRINITY_DN1459_c0_g1_i1:198-551(-)